MRNKIKCPFCKTKVEILHSQYISGDPDGGRYLGYHPMPIGKKMTIECPLGGAAISRK